MHKRLKIKFLGSEIDSPIVLPAGVMDMSFSSLQDAIINGAGIVTSKSLTVQPRAGHEGPVVAEFEGGMLNAMGLCNPGIDDGLKEIEQFKTNFAAPVIVSIFATNVHDFMQLAKKVDHSSAEFLELNLSCPNVFDEFGIPLAASPQQVFEIIKAVKEMTSKPVIAKLSPNVHAIIPIAESAQKAGADALCLINTVGPGMLIDIRMRKPILKNKFGGMSGPCIKPIALKLIYEVHSKIGLPIIGTGGVQSGEDVIEMWMAGASLVGVGTAVHYNGMNIFTKIKQEIIQFLEDQNYHLLMDVPRLPSQVREK